LSGAHSEEELKSMKSVPLMEALTPRKKAKSEAAKGLRELAAHSSPNTSASLLAQADDLCK